jgi:hypothetical protein
LNFQKPSAVWLPSKITPPKPNSRNDRFHPFGSKANSSFVNVSRSAQNVHNLRGIGGIVSPAALRATRVESKKPKRKTRRGGAINAAARAQKVFRFHFAVAMTRSSSILSSLARERPIITLIVYCASEREFSGRG